MIGKKIPNPKKSSNKSGRVTKLTNYITALKSTNFLEKCVHFEAANFLTNDLQSQQVEMIALATTAVRSKDPVDHYVLSWQEGERPTIEQAREAVEKAMKHLGLDGHQVIWGLHDDTNNMHVHICVNRVHPETLKVVEVNKGFQSNAIQQAAAIIEKTQGWKTHDKSRFKTDDLGHLIKDSKNLPNVFEKQKKLEPSGKTKDMEIQTGEKSAQRLAIENAPAIIASATSWADLHTKMQAAGMEYMRQGSGAAIKIGNTVVKASDVVDRKSNFGALQKRFGLYQPANYQEIKNDPRERTQLIDDDRFTTGYDEPNVASARFNTFNTLRHLPGSDLAKRPTTAQSKTANKGLLQFDESASRRRADGVRRGSHSDRTAGSSVAHESRERGPAVQQSGSQSIQETAETGEGRDRARGQITNGERRSAIFVREQAGQRAAGSINTRANRSTERGNRSEGKERYIATQHSSNQSGQGGKAAEFLHQRLNDKQTGWEQYKQIKSENDKAKNSERLELQKRHDSERAKLAEKLKAERSALLSGDWTGKGEARNLLQSTTAALQAAEKLEVQERQRIERKALQAKYKPFPMYKYWKLQPLIVAPVHTLYIEPIETQISVSQTLRSLTNRVDDRQHITYQLNKKDVFRDEGRTIKVLDLRSDAGIAAALAVAQQKFGQVLTLTGSPEFQQNAVAVAVNNNLTCKFADPALDDLRARLQADKYQVERATTRAATERLQAEEKAALRAKAPEVAQSNQTREADEPAPAPEGQQPVPVIGQEAAALAEAAEIQKGVEIEKAAEKERLSEPAQLADVQRQIEETKAESHHHSPMRSRPVVEVTAEDHGKPAKGDIVGSNETFVAASVGKEIKLYRVAELEKRPIQYDGLDEKGRFAKGNTIDIKSSKNVTVIERRSDMQTERQRQQERSKGISR